MRKSLPLNRVPLLVVNGVGSYLFLPLVTRIFRQSGFDAWDFEFARTAFLVIALLICLFLLWSCYLAAQLSRRVLRSR